MYPDCYSQAFDILDFSSSRVLNQKGMPFFNEIMFQGFFPQCLSHASRGGDFKTKAHPW
jgi:hypothetical protein